jgi:hypothetical protein
MLRTVRIVGAPVAIWARAQEHSDELIREFVLIASERERSGIDHDVPHRLTELIEEVTAQYGGFGEANEQKLLQAITAGVESLDLVYEMPPEVVDAVRHLGELLDEADEYCRTGEHLLTLATPPEQLAFRRWFLDEFVRQIAGEPPLRWADYAGSA